MGAFAEHAEAYGACGLRVFPAHVTRDGDNWRKQPAIKNWRKRATTRPSKLASDFPDAAIGILNDNALTVVDLDEPDLTDWAMNRFGETPVVIETPRGGNHLWYRHGGERRLIGIEGRKVDILGSGGYAIAPPSTRSDGRSWAFLKGSIDDLRNLPRIQPDALPVSSKAGAVMQGKRQNTLYTELRRIALECATYKDLALRANGINEMMLTPPLGQEEVVRCAKGVWQYIESGNLIVPGSQTAAIRLKDIIELSEYPPALVLWNFLKASHGPNHKFAVSPEGLSTRLSIGASTLKKARKLLVSRNHLRVISHGAKYRTKDGRVRRRSNMYGFTGG